MACMHSGALAALTDAALPKAKEPTFLFRGETVPVSEVSEHMRIELMDPRWKEQREAAERKSKETNLGPGTVIRDSCFAVFWPCIDLRRRPPCTYFSMHRRCRGHPAPPADGEAAQRHLWHGGRRGPFGD